jgi:hypothetical protein
VLTDQQLHLQRGAAAIQALDKRMRALQVNSPATLRGVPPPAGKHLKFDDNGDAEEHVHMRAPRQSTPLANAENVVATEAGA